MPRIVRLEAVGHLMEPATAEALDTAPAFIDRKVMLVYSGQFESMDGPVEVKPEDILRLVGHHNGLRAKLSRAITGGLAMKDCRPVQLDHSPSAQVTVGRIISDLSAEDLVIEEQPCKALFGVMRILGRENVEKVLDGRWTHVSIGADLEVGKLNELSITPFPAAPSAAMLANKKTELSGGSMDKEKLKKRLMDKEKMSAEDADKKLASMSEEDMKRMASDQDADDKKLAAEKEAEDKKEKEKKDAEMTAARAKLVTLTAGLRSGQKQITLAAKKASISARLSALRADAKISPAEIKKMDLEKLAGETPEVVEATLKSYSDREPVIMTGAMGSQKAEGVALLSQQYRADKMLLETALNMPSKRKDAEAKLAKIDQEYTTRLAALGKGGSLSDLQKDPKASSSAYDELCAMLDSGQSKEAVKAKLKSFMDAEVIQLRAGAADSEKQLSALAADVKSIQDQFNEVIALAGAALGVDSKDLA